MHSFAKSTASTSAATLEQVVELLSCPDDGQKLRLVNAELCCASCTRRFPIHADNFVEVLPKEAAALNDSIGHEYRLQYLDLFNQKVEPSDDSGIAWGAAESATTSWLRKRKLQVSAVGDLLAESAECKNLTICDFAAGAGHYTFTYAGLFKRVLHCDLSPHNLSYSRRKARELGLDNVFFLRIDYFRPPFRRCLDRIICLDTIIRGQTHDCLLVKSISDALRPDGEAVIDFHNWWHNPLRRVGLLKENFSFNKSYSRKEAESVLTCIGISNYKYAPFYQEFEPRRGWGKLCSRLVPPTRIMYSIRAAG